MAAKDRHAVEANPAGGDGVAEPDHMYLDDVILELRAVSVSQRSARESCTAVRHRPEDGRRPPPVTWPAPDTSRTQAGRTGYQSAFGSPEHLS